MDSIKKKMQSLATETARAQVRIQIQEMQKIKTQIQTQIIDARDDVFDSFQNQKKLEIQKFTNTGHKD